MGLCVALDARLVLGSSTGDSTYWTELVQALRADSGGLRILLLSNAPRPAEIPDTDLCRWVQVPGKGRWWSLVRFPLAARSLGADVVHTQYSLSPLASRGVTTVHDISFLIGPEWFKAKDRFLLRRTVPASCRRAAQVLTVSQTSKHEMLRAMPFLEGKIRVTPNACPSWIVPVPRDEARRRADALGLSGPYALTVGTRWPRKNMQLALDAVNGLPDSVPLTLAATGKAGWGPEALGSRGRATGYVDTATLSALYSGADLYLAPSRHEGFGIPLLEAFRCGCVCVASTGGALPEVAGGAAEIVESWEPSAWTGAIQRLLSEPSKLDDLRMRGYAREKEFTWTETARLTLAAYRDAAR